MILLDETAVWSEDPCGSTKVMNDYAKYIRTQISTRAFQFDYPANPIIVSAKFKDKAAKSKMHDRIKSQFRDVPLKLVYVDSHGQDGDGSVGAHRFFIGGVRYYSGEPAQVIDPNYVVVSSLTHKWNYGELGDDNNPINDPPKLVWIHACESAGSNILAVGGDLKPIYGAPTDADVYDPFPLRTGDMISWAECFGIDPARGYEGAFVGLSGYGKTINSYPSSPWTKMRYNFWYSLFTEGRNVRSALIQSVNQVSFLDRGFIRVRYRFYGTPTTSF